MCFTLKKLHALKQTKDKIENKTHLIFIFFVSGGNLRLFIDLFIINEPVYTYLSAPKSVTL